MQKLKGLKKSQRENGMLINFVGRTHGIISIFVVLLVVFCSPAIAKEKVIWLQQDAVLYFITPGEYKGQGYY